MSRFSLLYLAFPLLAASGCGGGGGTPIVPTPRPTPQPVATPLPRTCSNETYAPNYANNVELLRWRAFPLRVFFVRDADNSAARRALATKGFDQWATATNNRATYRVVSNPNEADITVKFYRFTGASGQVLGNTQYGAYSESNTLDSAEILLGISGDARNDGITAAHEFGHALGINHHSSDRDDLMFQEGNDTGCGCVTPRDLNTLLTAYCGNFNQAGSARLAPHRGVLTYGSID